MADIDLLDKGEADLDFDFGAKKKKKKKGAEQDGAEQTQTEAGSGAQETPAEDATLDDLEMFGDMKKKKKKKVVEAEAPKEDSVDDLMEDFDDMKKKKKKNMNMNEFEKELNEIEDDGEGDIVYSTEGASGEAEDSDVKFGSDATTSSEDPWVGTDREYTYKELLDRAFRIIKQANPDMEGGRKRYTMIPPQIVREGTKKTLFANLSEICKRMHRQPDHVISFLFSELGTTGSVDGGQRLIIKGRFQPTQIETVLRSYIVEYVTCKICKSPDTVLTKENRLTFMQCQSCGAKRSVSNIKSGFSAQVEKRKAQ